MSDTHSHLEKLTEKWNEVPNWTVLESWKGKGKESNNFYFKIYEDDNRVFVYCATRKKDRKGYIFDLKETDIASQLVESKK